MHDLISLFSLKEVLQTVILVAGAAILLVIGMVNVGGLSGLRQECVYGDIFAFSSCTFFASRAMSAPW